MGSEAGLKLSPQKCKFAQRKCLFLGSEISSAGIHGPEDRLTAVSEYPKPKNAKALKRYLGLMNWFKKFIQNYSAVANPLYKLLRKDMFNSLGRKNIKTLFKNSKTYYSVQKRSHSHVMTFNFILP